MILVAGGIEACPGGTRVEVTLEEHGERRGWRFTTPGSMSPEVLARLGTPFFTTREKEVGLGVVLARAVFEPHGGTLEYDSAPGQGRWDTLCRAIGPDDFLYVADSKLCSRDAMDHLDRRGGRFACVMPRSRLEDHEFRAWIRTHDPSWELVRYGRHPRRRHGPRDR